MATKATIVADCSPGEDVVVMALNAQGYHGVERSAFRWAIIRSALAIPSC